MVNVDREERVNGIYVFIVSLGLEQMRLTDLIEIKAYLIIKTTHFKTSGAQAKETVS